MILYYIMATTADVDLSGNYMPGVSKVVGIYTGKAEFEDALEDAPHNPLIEYETGELEANSPVFT